MEFSRFDVLEIHLFKESQFVFVRQRCQNSTIHQNIHIFLLSIYFYLLAWHFPKPVLTMMAPLPRCPYLHPFLRLIQHLLPPSPTETTQPSLSTWAKSGPDTVPPPISRPANLAAVLVGLPGPLLHKRCVIGVLTLWRRGGISEVEECWGRTNFSSRPNFIVPCRNGGSKLT